MVIFFDIDGTLLDQSTAERGGAIAVHRSVGALVPIEKGNRANSEGSLSVLELTVISS